MSNIGGIKTLLAASLMAASVYTDLKTRKIPNKMLFAALLFFAAADFAIDGSSGVLSVLGAVAAAVVCTLPLYIMKAIAAGDAKLILVSAVILPWQIVVSTCFWALCWGAVLGVAKILASGQIQMLVLNMRTLLSGQKLERAQMTAIPFSVAIFFGFGTAVTMSFWGVQWL